MTAIVYHNPRCSKSRETLKILSDNAIDYTCVLYLDTPLTVTLLFELKQALGFASLRDLMRVKEPMYSTLQLAETSDETLLAEAMVAHPKLLERPIVVVGERAKIGRPPEAVLSLFQDK